MPVTTPQWLAQHGGTIRPGIDGQSCCVVFDSQPQYLLVAVPASGKHSCKITQTINGRIVECSGAYPGTDDTLQAGLEALRKALGW